MSAPNTTAGLIQSLAQERVLLWCVLVSIALHALVLLGMSSRRAPAPAVKTLLVLTARLAPLAAAPPAPSQPKPALPTPPKSAAAPRPKPAKPSARPAQEVKRTAPAEPAKAPQPESAPAAPAAPAVEASAAPSAASIQASPAPSTPAGIPATEAVAKSSNETDTGTLEEYRLALIVATKRYKRYPAIALEKGWQGRVNVHMVIGANGMVASASIKTGSGHEILDKQALDMLTKGTTTVPIPASLRGREFSIDVPVIFNLDNPNS